MCSAFLFEKSRIRIRASGGALGTVAFRSSSVRDGDSH